MEENLGMGDSAASVCNLDQNVVVIDPAGDRQFPPIGFGEWPDPRFPHITEYDFRIQE